MRTDPYIAESRLLEVPRTTTVYEVRVMAGEASAPSSYGRMEIVTAMGTIVRRCQHRHRKAAAAKACAAAMASQEFGIPTKRWRL